MPLGTMKNRAAGLLFFLLLSPLFSLATHLRAGEITVERTNCTSLIFKITITVYTNTGSEIKFGEGTLAFGDGSSEQTPTIENTRRPDLGDAIGTVSYSVLHTYSGPGRYVISYIEPNRNGGILNIFNSVETRFYIETVINIDPLLGCNNSPKLLVPPIDKACTGAAWYHNPGAFDPDGDSISFEMTIPKKQKGEVVGNYRQPDNREFYDRAGINYGTANEAGLDAPKFSIDKVTGTLLWDAPGMQGEYNIAFQIKEWRKVSGKWVQMGYVVRDMQIIVEDCDNKRPELLVPEDICVEAGTVIDQDIFGFDPDSDPVKIEAFSQVFSLDPSRAIIIPEHNDFQPSSPTNHARIVFHWQTDCSHIKEQPYQVVFKITDNPPQGQRLIQFKTWNITVVGPAPKWNDAHTNPASRSASLKWDKYACESASTMEIWRRVDMFPFTPPECVTGMPDFLGYTKISEVPISQSTFVDTNNGKGLAIGAQYCYRLVAIFPKPGGGESYVSQEVCIDPLLADAPVITNVTVDKTASQGGQITVKWMPPFDADPAQFPPPYKYEVYRAEGITGNIKVKIVHPGKLTDTTFTDNDAALNTEGIVYNYRIVAYDANSSLVDTSDVASSVRLEAKPLLKKIEISWFAEVPWSNQTDKYPLHDIYRGPANATEAQLVLIGTVDVNKDGFKYVDEGQHNNQPLQETETYCYRVMTRGSYGNPKIAEPLANFSQKMCAQPNDNTPPCKPELSIIAKTCDEIMDANACGTNIFSNVLSWNRPPDQACRNDIRSYNIYRARNMTADFFLIAQNVVDTFYVDGGLGSYARCYKIEAVDRSGNKSEMSEQFCFDNCPHYELPNVFTPNDSDGCNTLFSAFSDKNPVDENGNPLCANETIDLDRLKGKCARFVLAVDFKVYNRWGTEVYTYQGDSFREDNPRAIYIDWNGKDSQGSDLSAGIYYYVANVTYDVVDPSKATQAIKGWVHLVR